jgi:hypothetical protein
MNELVSNLDQLLDRFDLFVVGAVAMGHWVAGLFFLRFWYKTRDRFFALFAVAFWILGLNRLAMVPYVDLSEHHFVYWVRLAAYLVILVAILDKNRSK